jgi:hypothetical protein
MKICVPFFILIFLVLSFAGCSKHTLVTWSSSASDILDPESGIGPLHSDMTISEVIAKLGEPDDTFDGFCDYTNLGLRVYFGKEKLVSGVWVKTPFAGHTKKGIGIGVDRAEVLNAYGEPTDTSPVMPKVEAMFYRPLVMTFQIKDGKVDSIIVNFKNTK